MSPLGAPPTGSTDPAGVEEALRGFPEEVLPPGTAMARIHRADDDPWWFGSSGHGRFDLEAPRGTCYLAREPLGAFLEVFRTTVLVDHRDVLRRRLSLLSVDRPLRLADCAARGARAYGVTDAIHSTPDRATTRAWAAAFATAGFDGVRYLVSHDPAQRLVGYALFGEGTGEPAEGAARPPAEAEPIPDHVLRAAREHFGILVVPGF